MSMVSIIVCGWFFMVCIMFECNYGFVDIVYFVSYVCDKCIEIVVFIVGLEWYVVFVRDDKCLFFD